MRVVKQTLSNRRDTNNVYKSAEKADPNAVCLYLRLLQLYLLDQCQLSILSTALTAISYRS